MSERRFTVVRRRGEAFERVGDVNDIDAIVRLKADGAALLRSANPCDGSQAALHELVPKLERRADFSGH